jgi:hypothetical protein
MWLFDFRDILLASCIRFMYSSFVSVSARRLKDSHDTFAFSGRDYCCGCHCSWSVQLRDQHGDGEMERYLVYHKWRAWNVLTLQKVIEVRDRRIFLYILVSFSKCNMMCMAVLRGNHHGARNDFTHGTPE